MTNFYAELAQGFERNAQADCLRMPGQATWSYGDLQDKVNQCATVLVDQGVNAGERVVVQVEKSAWNLALYLAVLKVGGVYVPLNIAYTDRELAYFVEDAQPVLFVGQAPRNDVPSLTLTPEGGGSFWRCAGRIVAR